MVEFSKKTKQRAERRDDPLPTQEEQRGTEPPPIERAIIQAKLSVGPASDRYEREADSVADRVVQTLDSKPDTDVDGHTDDPASEQPQRVQRSPLAVSNVQWAAAVGLDGGDLDHDTSSEIEAARGGGRAMPDVMRSQMEGAFGADFSGVRVHEGAKSAELNDRIQAKAFTVGNDIFFRDNLPSTNTSEGKHLLAHELTHTIQQGAAAQRSVQREPAEANIVPPVVREHRPTSHVQAKFGKKLKGFKNKVKSLFGRASKKGIQDTEIESPVLDDATHEETVEHAQKTKGSGPGENPDYSNTALWGEQPDGYQITLAVAQDRPDWMADVKALKKAALSNPGMLIKALNGADVEVPSPDGTGKMTKNPKDVVTSIAHESREAERAKEGLAARSLEEFTDGIHEVGHTWVRLDTMVKGQVKERYSYGMWPQKVYDPENDASFGGYAGFIDAGPGEIRHPDTHHEGDSLTAYQDYKVGRSSWNKAHSLAVKRYNSPPPYVLTGYNCTAFAREIVTAGGGSYPGSGLLPGFGYTPGNLYAMILARTEKNRRGARAGGSDADEAITERIDARHGAWEEAGKNAADAKHHKMTGELSPRARKALAEAQPQRAAERTITVWNGTVSAPNVDDEPFEVRLWRGAGMFRPTGQSGNGFIEVTDAQTSDFFWLSEAEYLAGGTPDPDDVPSPDTTDEEDLVEHAPWDEVVRALDDYRGFDITTVNEVIGYGGLGITHEDLRAGLLAGGTERAEELGDMFDCSANEVLGTWASDR